MFVNKPMVYSFQILVLYYPHLPSTTSFRRAVRPTRVLWRWDGAHLRLRNYTYKFFLRQNPMYHTIPIPFSRFIPLRPRRTLRQRALNTRVSYLVSP